MASDDTTPDTTPGPIEGYALLSDLRTAALVDTTGSIDWLCLPRFDSPSVFARLLGDENHGRWQIAPTGEYQVSRAYRDNTLVLDTEFRTDTGVVRLTDTMLPREVGEDRPTIVRVVEGVSGSVEMRLRWVLRPAYGDSLPWVRHRRHEGCEYLSAVSGPTAVTLLGVPLPTAVRGAHRHEAVFTLTEGQRAWWVMSYQPEPDGHPVETDAVAELAGSERFWRQWAQRIDYDGPYAEAVHRSLTVLKGLTYAPRGGIVASPTTSLPETPGGERNWDYRYCWLRDATLTLLAFNNYGCIGEARAWRDWLLRAITGNPAELQIMYGIDGARHLQEWEADWLPGYQGARPVRVGNAAYRQLQLDVYGEVMDALHLARERGLPETADSWSMQCGMMRHLEKIWQQPDNGLWEVRGKPRHFTYSRVMLWVAFDRAVRAVEEDGLSGPVERWRELRDTLREEVLEKGWNDSVGAFTQYYGGTELDAATLRIPTVGMLAGDDKRMLATIEAIGRELKHGDLIDRYSTGEKQSHVDGLSGREGSFVMCSFWYVDALALAGRHAEAEAMFERLLALRNDVGLLAEEYHRDERRFLGNFPQAFSHLALANAAAVLYRDTHATYARHERSRRNGVTR
ncbi:MAG: glycoside hydrolase family 15 protein [Sciscionella sp.]